MLVFAGGDEAPLRSLSKDDRPSFCFCTWSTLSSGKGEREGDVGLSEEGVRPLTDIVGGCEDGVDRLERYPQLERSKGTYCQTSNY